MENFLQSFPLLLGGPEGGAGGGGGGGGQLVTTFVTFGLVIVIFYFLIIRPQNKKQREAKNMLSNLKKGDKVATVGGIRGTVVSVKDQVVLVKVDDTVKLEFSKSAISSVLEQKSEKDEPSKDAPKLQ